MLLKLGDSLGPLAGHVVEVICEDVASLFLSISTKLDATAGKIP